MRPASIRFFDDGFENLVLSASTRCLIHLTLFYEFFFLLFFCLSTIYVEHSAIILYGLLFLLLFFSAWRLRSMVQTRYGQTKSQNNDSSGMLQLRRRSLPRAFRATHNGLPRHRPARESRPKADGWFISFMRINVKFLQDGSDDRCFQVQK